MTASLPAPGSAAWGDPFPHTQRSPTGLNEGLIGFLEPLRRAHLPVFQGATLFITDLVEGEEQGLTDVGRLSQHELNLVRCGFFVTGKFGQLIYPDKLFQDKLDVSQWGFINGSHI